MAADTFEAGRKIPAERARDRRRDQDRLAEHFARGVPPIAMWQGVAVREDDGAPLLDGALGWLVCRVEDELVTGTHTFFVLDVLRAERGSAAVPLLRLGGDYRAASA